MARNFSQAIIEEKNRDATAFPWLILLTIVLNDDDSTTYRLVNNNEDITFDGNVYSRFSFELDPTKYSSRGEISTLTLKVNNINRFIQPKLEELGGGVGSAVTITVVNTRFLKDDFSEAEETFEVLSTKCDTHWVSFTLGGWSLLRRRMPLYRYIAGHCRWSVNSVECGLTGATCNRTYANCKTNANTARYGGFMGLNSAGLKIV